MRTVAFHNLGCKVNTYEMEVMQQKFAEAGYKIVPFDSVADVYVINTCSVTNIADHKSRQMLHKAKRRNPESVVIAAGCYSQTDTEGAAADDAVDIVLGNNRKAEITDVLNEYYEKTAKSADREVSIVVDDLNKPSEYEECGINDSNERTRVDIKIQDGCDQFCSYCIIPAARGRVRSRDKDSIIKEVTALAAKGYKEVVLTGIHLSSYGIDFASATSCVDAAGSDKQEGRSKYIPYNILTRDGDYTNKTLIDIIKSVAAIKGISRIRLGSLEPRVITEEFVAAISAIDEVCPHFHLSLQSGCDDTLKRMNRRYTADEYYEKVKLLRGYYVNPAITTDIIVGFPGETEEEFDKTVKFVNKVNFFETHIFKYSKRRGTVAAGLPGQITEAVKGIRSDVLLDICDKNREAFLRDHIGKTVEILIEESRIIDGQTMLIGHTKEYMTAAIPVSDEDNVSAEGMIISAVADSVNDAGLLICSNLRGA